MLSSVSIILVLIYLLHSARKVVKNSSAIGEPLKDLLLCGLCALELGSVSLEQGVLMETQGFLVWSISLVLVVTWQIAGWDGLSPNALPHIVEGSGQSLRRVPAMLVGSLISYRLMTCVWAAEISTHHKDRAAAIAAGVCVIPWRHQPTLNVIAMEYTGTLLLTLLPRMVFTNTFLANNDSHKVIRGAVISLIVLVVVVFGMEISGSMFNPTLAALLVGGCQGYSLLHHLAFYWLVPVLGAVSGTILYNQYEKATISSAKSSKESKKLK